MLMDAGKLPEQLTSVSAEICVVGAGPAGLAAAIGLARQGKSVVLLESGPVETAEWLEDINGVVASSEHYRGPKSGRARTLGGTSSLWGGRLIPLNQEDMAEREMLDIPAWPITHDELYAKRHEVEALFGVSRGEGFDLPAQSSRQQRPLYDDDGDVRCRAPKVVPLNRRNIYRTHRR